MSKSTDNRSLFIYTGLIFLVAILMIILAFFGQSKLEKSQPIQSENTAAVAGITEKAAVLSEENRVLLEQNKEFTTKNEELTLQNQALTEQAATLQKENDNNNRLLAVYQKLYENKKADAKSMLAEIYTDDLSDMQKVFFDILVKKTQ